jgi:hypothetical protein
MVANKKASRRAGAGADRVMKAPLEEACTPPLVLARIKRFGRICEGRRHGGRVAIARASGGRRRSDATPQAEAKNAARYCSARVEGAKYGVSSGSEFAIAVSHGNDRSLLWTIVEGLLATIYVIYFAIFFSCRDDAPRRFH